MAGLLRFPWAYWLGWAIQVAAIALGFEVGAMFFLGAIFLALWATAYFLGRKIERRARRVGGHGGVPRTAPGRGAGRRCRPVPLRV